MLNDCLVVNTVICDSFNDLIVQCLDYVPSANPPDFQREFIKINKNKYLPSFWYNGKKVYTCRNSFKDEDANVLCKSEGYEMGGVNIELSTKDPKPPINKLISFASKFTCPHDLETIGKKCKVMILPEEQTCDENYQLIKCFGEKSIVQN